MTLNDFSRTCVSRFAIADIYSVKSADDLCDVDMWNHVYSGFIDEAYTVLPKEVLQQNIVSWSAPEHDINSFSVFIIM